MKIKNETDYKKAFQVFEALTAEMADSPAKQVEARLVAEAIQAYEQEFVLFPRPSTLSGMIELKMYEMKLKQKDLAELLEVEASRVSEILNGKRKITLDLAKKLHKKLGIDGNFILEVA